MYKIGDKISEFQTQITLVMRILVLDWLVLAFGPNNGFLLTTLFVDLMLLHLQISPPRLKLLGTTAMWVATKLEFNKGLRISEMQILSRHLYYANEIRSFEQKMFLHLFHHPNLFHQQIFLDCLFSTLSPDLRTCVLLEHFYRYATIYNPNLLVDRNILFLASGILARFFAKNHRIPAGKLCKSSYRGLFTITWQKLDAIRVKNSGIAKTKKI